LSGTAERKSIRKGSVGAIIEKAACERLGEKDEDAKESGRRARQGKREKIEYQKECLRELGLLTGTEEQIFKDTAQTSEEVAGGLSLNVQDDLDRQCMLAGIGLDSLASTSTVRTLDGKSEIDASSLFSEETDVDKFIALYMNEADDQLDETVDKLEEQEHRAAAARTSLATIQEGEEMEIEYEDVGASQTSNLGSGVYSPERYRRPPTPSSSPAQKQVSTREVQVSSFKQRIVVNNVPSTHVVIQTSLLTSLKEDRAIVLEIRQNLRNKRFAGGEGNGDGE